MPEMNSILLCKRPCTLGFAYLWMSDPLHHQKMIVNSGKWNDTTNFELSLNHCFTHHWLLFTYLCSSVTICVILLWLCQCDKIIHPPVSLAYLLEKLYYIFHCVLYFYINCSHRCWLFPLGEKVFHYGFFTCDWCFLKNRMWFLVYCGIPGTY